MALRAMLPAILWFGQRKTALKLNPSTGEEQGEAATTSLHSLPGEDVDDLEMVAGIFYDVADAR